MPRPTDAQQTAPDSMEADDHSWRGVSLGAGRRRDHRRGHAGIARPQPPAAAQPAAPAQARDRTRDRSSAPAERGEPWRVPTWCRSASTRASQPIAEDGDPTVLITVTVAFVVAAMTEYLAKRSFLMASGRIGQAVLYDLRTRVYDHFQRLSPAFHERYTSGRVISRLTSDVDALGELLDGGVDDLVLAGLSVVSVGAILLVPRPADGPGHPAELPVPALAVPLVPPPLGDRLPPHPRDRGPRDRALRRVARRHPCGPGVPPRGPQPGDLRRRSTSTTGCANERAFKLVAIFAPGIKLIGNVTIAVVLVYGGYRVMDGQVEVGVLAAFLLYLRRFFEPMQELSMFYNSLQSATAALEKLSGVLEETLDRGRAGEPGLPPRVRGSVDLDHVTVRVPRGHGPARPRPAHSRRARRWRWSGPQVRARRPSRGWSPASTTRSRAPCGSTGSTSADLAEEDLRRTVVMVTQENFLFSDTVANNIRFGRPSASDDAVRRRLGPSEPTTSSRPCPDGLRHRRRQARRTPVGRPAAAGRVRASIPRRPGGADPRRGDVVARHPERTPGATRLRTILADRTAIIIAHRLSTVEIADRVIVLRGGPDGGERQSCRAAARRRAATPACTPAWLESLL